MGNFWEVFWLLLQNFDFGICTNVGSLDLPEVEGRSIDDTFVEIFDPFWFDIGIFMWTLETHDALTKYFSNITHSVQTLSNWSEAHLKIFMGSQDGKGSDGNCR